MNPRSNNFSPNQIIDLMQRRDKEETDLVLKAFEFSRKAHEGQNRLSGEPYFVHALETGKILASMDVSGKTIAVGLLHETMENPSVTSEKLTEEFGEEVVFLIDGVTKLGKLKFHGTKRYNEGLRKLFVAMAQDIRVIIVKLADRLDSMEMLRFMPQDKQVKIAEETLEIFAPIANRLGIGQIRKQLEDKAFPYVFPKEYEQVKELMNRKSGSTQKKLEKVYRTLQKKFAEEGIKVIKTDYRLKGLYSLWNKLKKHNMEIDRIYDISALRIVVPEVSDCYKVLGIIHSIWRPLPGRIKDYIALPKPNGYRSVHTTIFTGETEIVEIQVRTEEMHKEAEFGIASHLSYKEKTNRHDSGLFWIFKLLPFRKKFDKKNVLHQFSSKESDAPKWVKELAQFQMSSNQKEFETNLKTDFFKERIFVFTPKGDVVDLPIESGPIDFAYNIHSDIGNHIFGSKINGKFVSLDTKLQNGDIVEILTKSNSHPTERWLALAKTSLAQKQIRTALEKK